MKKLLSVILIFALALALTVPVFADPYVFHIQQENEEKIKDRLFELEREQDWEVNGLPEYAAPVPNAPDPTPEQVEQYKQQAQQRLAEIQEDNRVDMSLESERNGKLMGMVFGDKLHEVDIPDSTFQGEYQEFTGKDGSVTRVYPDGSVDTEYTDGSWEGMDSCGNRATKDKDGNEQIQLLNGDVVTVKEDGSYVVKQTDGATVTYRTDNTATWTNDSGLVIDYNEYGERTSIGFEGGDKVDLVYGQLPPGDQKITGPKGAYLEWHNGETAELSDDGTYVVEGDGGYNFTVKGVDGTGGKLAQDPFVERIDEEATIAKKQETNGQSGTVYTSDEQIGISTMDGGAYDVRINNDDPDKISVTYENPNGDVFTEKDLGGGKWEKSFTSADGKEGYRASLDENGLNVTYKDKDGEHTAAETTVDENGNIVVDFPGNGKLTVKTDQSIDLDTEDGLHISVDSDGNPKELTAKDNYIKWDENGNVTDAHLTNDDGGSLTMKDGVTTLVFPDGGSVSVTENPDGTMTAVFPDGTVRTKDASGEWLKEGEYTDGQGNIYDKDGNLVKGANDAAGFDDPSSWAKPEQPYEDAPAETTPPAETVPVEPAPAPSGGGLAIENIVGTYHDVGGSYYRTVNEEWKEVWLPTPDYTLDVFDAGGGKINSTLSVTGKSMPEPLSYDPATGVATLSYKSEGIAVPMVYTLTFTDLGGGKVSLHVVSDWGGDQWMDLHCEK